MEQIENTTKEGLKTQKILNNTSKNQEKPKKSNQDSNNPNQEPRNENKPTKNNKRQFKFNNDTVEILIFKKLDARFLKDLSTHISVNANRRSAIEAMKKFFTVKENLQDSARLSHLILQDMTSKCPEPKVPRVIVSVFVEILIKNKDKIKHLLNQKGGDKLLDTIPLEYMVDVIELYNLRLSKKDANIFFRELSNSRYFSQIPRFIAINSHLDFEKELTPIIQRLISQKEYKKLRMIPNLKKLFKENPVLVQEKNRMLRNTAMYHFRSEGWEYLEEIFEFHPAIIAGIINGNFGSRPSQFQKDEKYLQGVVAICQRNSNVLDRLKPDTKKVITEKKAQMQKNGKRIPQNPLRVNQFMPSSEEHFSFQEFQVSRHQVVWVDDKLDNQKLKQIKEQLLDAKRIAIDTESTLVRTPIDHDLDVLSLIQISTDNKIYLIDPYNSKHPEIKSMFKNYFGNPNKIVIGHTIQGDVGGIAHFFQIQQPICKVIDVKIEYQKFANTKKQVSLKAISKQILGKQICKKYTCTNWDRRPLNLCQIHYAAMDAYIIIKIWDKLQVQIEQKKKNPQIYEKANKKIEQLNDQNQNQEQKSQQKLSPEYQDTELEDKTQ